MNTILRFYRTPWLLAVAAALLLNGCYYFVHDSTPPEWDGPATAQEAQGEQATAAGGPGASIFNTRCVTCHQSNAKGLPGVYPPLAGSHFATGDPRIPIRIVLHGFHGPIERDGRQYNGVMQPWGNVLSDEEIADVLTFVRSSFGNNATAVEPAMVKQIREATENHNDAFTEDELNAVLKEKKKAS